MKIDNYPQSLEQFIELRNQIATTPEGGLACFIIALREYAEKGEEALPWLIICREINDLQESNQPGNYKGYTLGRSELSRINSQFARQKYIANSYFVGATPENNYTVPATAEFQFSSNKYSGDPSEGETKIFVGCSGASTPRPSRLKRNEKGIWKVKEYSSLIVGIMGADSEKRVDDL
ncbi:MAG: hypothetical protein C0592_14615 [Marinilabiliales bacterium]|nr:MAG: hypothetical protein C0592_14615 [Marinilabiliales bacterium]